MKMQPQRMRSVFPLVAIVAAAACGTTAPEPGQVSPTVLGPPAAEAGTEYRQGRHTDGDVRFIRQMIPHHAQALEMTALVPTRTRREDIRRLAMRIEVSQRDEIELMHWWLRQRGQDVPRVDAHEAHDHGPADPSLMAGMLTREEIAGLAGVTGAEFDRLFLESMIRHHEGALTMVAELFATEGAAQDSQVFRLASDIDADQRAEIARMRRLLEAAVDGSAGR